MAERLGPESRVVVVGAGLAAVRTIEALRQQGYPGHIRLLGAEESMPYDRPPLSKGVLTGAREETLLPFDPATLDVEVHTSRTATGLRPGDFAVETEAGDVSYDALVIATGATPVRLPGDGEQLTVRTLGDALRLRDRLRPGAHVVLIGASWIGAEVATAALARGCQVTCLEAASAPSLLALGSVAHQLLPWWSEVDLRLNTQVARIGNGSVTLADGSSIAADAIVVGVGVRPETRWLEGSGLTLDRGVVVDAHLLAEPGIVAVGDVAAWWSDRWSRRLRVEHWDFAGGCGPVAAASLLGPGESERPAYNGIPYFWSDQFGHKLQYVGSHVDGDFAAVRSNPETGAWSAAWIDPQGILTAALSVDRPREMIASRKLIGERQQVDVAAFADPSVPLAAALV